MRQGHRAGQPPLQRFTKNQIWCAIVALAADLLLVWMQTLALAGHDARRWEPERVIGWL